VLHMRHSRHRHIAIGFRLQQERVQHGFQACWICAAASMTNSRKSVAISSLRLRPVWSFQPSGPSSSTSAFSRSDARPRSRAERFEPRGIGFRAIRNFVERRQRLLHSVAVKIPMGSKALATPDRRQSHKAAAADQTQTTAGTRRTEHLAHARSALPTAGRLCVQSLVLVGQAFLLSRFCHRLQTADRQECLSYLFLLPSLSGAGHGSRKIDEAFASLGL